MKTTPWLVRLSGLSSASVRLFAFPFSGGSAGAYASWGQWLPAEVELHGIQLPGRGMRMAEPLIGDLRTVATQLLPALLPMLDRPYALYGHSNGALMAFVMLNRLLHAGARPPEAIILSAKPAPGSDRSRAPMSQLPEAQFLEKLRSLDGTPPELLADPEIMRLFAPAIRADFALGENYVAESLHPGIRQIPALILAGEQDEMAVSDVFAWREMFDQAQCLSMQGKHFFINSNPQFPLAFRRYCKAVGGPLGGVFRAAADAVV
ncbi:thioesterase domain-containing protein [Chitinimonas viridis]|uniref:Thioesterase domain-containing protein n=1 Tax=Chitinimonas viridis TaxID=664880 RepID=A0ABT8B7T0_9NEIS|nr:thioesterase domain-containing protein [Chitinimonas viridis]MDN3578317.1 thioesterase domain-containing protein [Chitinimonas viridis]